MDWLDRLGDLLLRRHRTRPEAIKEASERADERWREKEPLDREQARILRAVNELEEQKRVQRIDTERRLRRGFGA